jgi:hypothetical protein
MNTPTNSTLRSGSAAVTLGLLFTATVLGIACGKSEPQPPPPPPAPETTMPTMSVSAEPPVVEAPKPPPAPPIELVEGTPATPPEKAPTLTIKSPAKNQVIAADKANDFEVKLDLKGWDAPAGGNHVHLIIDNKPYKRIDDPKQPIKLKDIDPNYTIGEGEHVLVAFPSRHTHEAVKPIGKASPLAVVQFFVGKKGEVKWKPTDPTLIFSRPKGANNGPPPAEGILVDYYLANAELGDGKFSIEAMIKGPGAEAGTKLTSKTWTPLRIKNVQSGTYAISLKLLDKDGKQVPGAWNETNREFQVDLAAPADAHAPAAAPAMSGSAAAPAASGSAAPKNPKFRQKLPAAPTP